MFSDENVKQIVAAATSAGIEPAAFLAIIECETNGSPFENDGRTPTLLYERHVAYREAAKVGRSVLNAFVNAGLAIPKWSRSTQYKDERTSALRLALIARARAIHEEVANASASWGLGQTLGNQFEELGFDSATDLVNYMTEGGLPAQLRVMVAEIKAKSLIRALNNHDWATFARRYNGPAYAQNQYDVRMAAAYKRWSRKVETVTSRATPPAHQTLSDKEIKALQSKLYALGYTMVGRADGLWGPNTVAALNAFQHYEGLPESGDYDAATKDALATAEPRLQARERANVTADDLRGKSRIIDGASAVVKTGGAKVATGVALLGGGTAEQAGLLGQAQDAVDKAQQAKTILGTLHGWLEPILGNPTTVMIGVGLIAIGFVVVKYGKAIIEARVDDHRSGAHTGGDT